MRVCVLLCNYLRKGSFATRAIFLDLDAPVERRYLIKLLSCDKLAVCLAKSTVLVKVFFLHHLGPRLIGPVNDDLNRQNL